MQSQDQEISYRALLKERNRSFSEAEVTSILEQILPQLADIHLHQTSHGFISIDVLLLVNHEPTLRLPSSPTAATISPSQDIVDLGFAMIELLTTRSSEVMRGQGIPLNWEDDCVVSDRLATLLNQMIAGEITFPAQALALLKGVSAPGVGLPAPIPTLPPAPLVPAQPIGISRIPLTPISPHPTVVPVKAVHQKPGLKLWQWILIGFGSTLAIALAGFSLLKLGGGANSASFLPNISLRQEKENLLFQISEGGKVGFIDRTGKVVIPVQYENASIQEVSGDLIPVSIEGKFGYIDRKNQVVIAPQFSSATPFSEGMAAVITDGKKAYIDQTGKIIFYLAPEQEFALPVIDGLVPIKVGESWGYADKTGKIIIIPQFEAAFSFRDGLAPVRVAGKVGLIDKSGKFVVNPQFSALDFAVNGLGAVLVNEKWGFIDKTGNMVISPQFDSTRTLGWIEDFSWNESSNSLIPVRIGEKWGYVDRTGKIVINPLFQQAELFSDGLAAVRLGETWAYIDQAGKIVINPQFYTAGKFSQGIAPVMIEGRRGYINRSGTFIWSTADANITSPEKQKAKAETQQNVGSMNRAQQAFYIENLRFGSTVQELGLGILPENQYYSYSVTLPTPGQALNLAIPKTGGLPSFVGGVFTAKVSGSSEMTTLAILCVTNQPSQTPPGVPRLVNGEPQCPLGSSRLN